MNRQVFELGQQSAGATPYRRRPPPYRRGLPPCRRGLPPYRRGLPPSSSGATPISSGVIGHITSLNPIRPENGPDDWEAGALRAFDQGAAEVSTVATYQNDPYMRLMRPLYVEENCLPCHAKQGYVVGQVRGGISENVPLAPLDQASRSYQRGVDPGACRHLAGRPAGAGGVRQPAQSQPEPPGASGTSPAGNEHPRQPDRFEKPPFFRREPAADGSGASPPGQPAGSGYRQS